jgi:hypothetical protein
MEIIFVPKDSLFPLLVQMFGQPPAFYHLSLSEISSHPILQIQTPVWYSSYHLYLKNKLCL